MWDRLARSIDNGQGLFLILGVSALFKTAMALCTPVINPDGVLYINTAMEFAQGHWRQGLALASKPMPFISLLIALLHWVIPDWVAAASCILVLSSVLVLVPLYLLTVRLFDRQAAFWACALFAVAPLPNRWAVEIIRDPPFLLFLAWSIYWGLVAVESRKIGGMLLALGAAMVAALFRIEATVVIPLLLLFRLGVAEPGPRPRAAWLKRGLAWVFLGLVLVGSVLIIGKPEWGTVNRVTEPFMELRKLWSLQFLDNYRILFKHLRSFQDLLPNPEFEPNFVSITRNYLAVIYLIGILDSLVKVVFFSNVIPLVFGFRHAAGRERLCVLVVACTYFLIAYYFIIDRTWVTDRYLLVPAFLLFPWVGMGFSRMLELVRASSRPRLAGVMVMVVFLILPVGKSIRSVAHEDRVVRTAAEWIAAKPAWQHAKLLTNEPRIPFYAGSGLPYLAYDGRDYGAMEELGVVNGMDVIIIHRSLKNAGPLSEFNAFRQIKEFSGRKSTVVLWCSSSFYETCVQ
jgi:4-amino-4-deoxy-L-arabinose transferase-like glycosyltransferase